MFSQLYGFFKLEDANALRQSKQLPFARRSTKNHPKEPTKSVELDIPYCDIYVQEYFFSAFAHLL